MTIRYSRGGHIYRWVKLIVDNKTWRVIDESDLSNQLIEGMDVSMIVDGNGLITHIDW